MNDAKQIGDKPQRRERADVFAAPATPPFFSAASPSCPFDQTSAQVDLLCSSPRSVNFAPRLLGRRQR